MKIGLACIILMGTLSGTALAESDEALPLTEKATGLLFPARIGKFQRTSYKVSPDPRYGVAIRYEGPGQAEVSVYDMGYGEIPTGVDSDAVRMAFAQSQIEIERLLAEPPASGGKKFAESTPVIESEGRVAKMRVGLYSWTYAAPDGTRGPMATWVVLTAFKNRFLKLLYTSPALDPMAAQGEVKQLIAGFIEANPKERQNFLVEKKAPGDAQAPR